MREPELIFWIFGFPLLLALGLGIAFRNKPAEVTSIAIVSSPGAQEIANMIQRSPQASSIRVQVLEGRKRCKPSTLANTIWSSSQTAREACVTSTIHRDRKPCCPAPKWTMLCNPARGERILCQLLPLSPPNRFALHRFSDSWPVGYDADEFRHVGSRIRASGYAPAKITQEVCGHAHAKKRLPACTCRQPPRANADRDRLLLGLGMLAFHIRVLGSLWNILLLVRLGSVAFGGFGLLTACRAQKIETVSGLINLAMMPMWIFSGVFFSYEHFPAEYFPYIKALPLTALNDALRTTILQGASLSSQAGRIAGIGPVGRNLFRACVTLVPLDLGLLDRRYNNAWVQYADGNDPIVLTKFFAGLGFLREALASLARLANSFLEYMLPRQFFAPQ